MKLNNILEELSGVQEYYNIHVIDDSHKTEVIKSNINLASKFGNNSYLGKEAFINFYDNNFFEDKSSEDIIGTKDWNLGSARNFALDFSIIENYEKVLFIDDDISDISINDLDLGFKTLSKNNFVSCHLNGKIDDSIVGHIAREFNVVYEESRMLSGGFWFLYPKSLNYRFFNVYNEDWILQLLENDKEQIMLPFTVIHDKNEKSTLKEDDIYFQEIGEIIVEALLLEKNALKMKSKFWSNIILERITYIQELIQKARILNKHNEIGILINLNNWLEKLTTEKIFNFINTKHERKTY